MDSAGETSEVLGGKILDVIEASISEKSDDEKKKDCLGKN